MLTSASGGVSFTYDPMTRLYSTSSGYRFAYDGLDLVAEYNNGGAMVFRHVFGPGVDEPVVSYIGSGTDRRFLAADERGTVVLMTDNAGTAWQVNRYDEFGKPGASNSGRFQYTGQVWLPEIGVQYSKARMYAPHLGRFLQTDPIGYWGGPNLYAYVLNDPVNWVDPLGLVCVVQGGTTCPVVGAGPVTIIGTRPTYTAIGGGAGTGGHTFVQPNLVPRQPGRGGTPTSKEVICKTPLHGGGTIQQNVATIENMLESETAVGNLTGLFNAFGMGTKGIWLRNVAPGGAWAGRIGEPWGNWNYGATGRAAGISLGILLRAAGAAEQIEALTGRTGSEGTGQGNPFGGPPYGDNPWSQAEIVEGYNARCN